MAALDDHSLDRYSSLSAMFDGEATNKDVESLLTADNGELSRQLESFHLIQQTLHKEPKVAVGLEDRLVLSIRTQIDAEDLVAEGLSAESVLNVSELSNNGNSAVNHFAIDDTFIPFVSPTEKVEAKASKSVWRVMFSSVAVAASVTLVVIFGGNALLTSDIGESNLTADTQLLETNSTVTSLAELNKNGLHVDSIKLQNYLRQHVEQSSVTVGQGMIPMARVVSYRVKE